MILIRNFNSCEILQINISNTPSWRNVTNIRKRVSIISISLRHMNVNAWHHRCRRNPFRGWQVDQMAPPADVLMPVRSPSTTVTRFDLRHVVGPGNAITSWRMNLVVSNCGFSRTYNWPTNREVLDLFCEVTFEFPVLLGQAHIQLSYVYLSMVPIVVFIAFPRINIFHLQEYRFTKQEKSYIFF